ncbi:hypothetical protein A167_00755 [Alcanivorax sp. S71-1-4]|uniref:DUF1461 domain-containing protein n=1 Tax=Alcanivorax sp. S71-1-4 TaxID=1177159 RepID=UPI00135958EC|nr:DUF1461 domain-containing protein [Alcanivorax sp. S71-1-4]KAF0810475.1 hypothetical protein A167_00755 [Alcanivorax sp. S71-1-4]
MGGQHTERLQQTGRGLIWLGYSLCCVWLALALAWWLYARIDYSYPLWYDVLDIDRHIAEYAPHNARKPGFAQLPPEQHYQAFAQISRAVHDNGKGLGEIVYRGPGGRDIPLLDRDERVHLEDVARLLRLGGYASLIALLGWVPLALALARTGLPGWRARLAGAALMASPVGLWLLVSGPKAVFYQFHIWLFPPENPWFFYWEESLMSTLMKAPYLFGGIAVVLAVAAVLMTPLWYVTGRALARRFGGAHA